MMKNFEADQKRLKAIMINFDEKKPDMTDVEKRERQDLIQMSKDCYNLFKLAMNEQTSRIEKSAGRFVNQITQAEIHNVDQSNVNSSSSRVIGSKEISGRRPPAENETQQAFLEDTVAIQSKRGQRNGDLSTEFDNMVNKIGRYYVKVTILQMRQLEEMEKTWVLGEYDFVRIIYLYLCDQDDVIVDPYAIKFDNLNETMADLRKESHCHFDICLIMTTFLLVTLCLELLKLKGYITSYHVTSLPT